VHERVIRRLNAFSPQQRNICVHQLLVDLAEIANFFCQFESHNCILSSPSKIEHHDYFSVYELQIKYITPNNTTYMRKLQSINSFV